MAVNAKGQHLYKLIIHIVLENQLYSHQHPSNIPLFHGFQNRFVWSHHIKFHYISCLSPWYSHEIHSSTESQMFFLFCTQNPLIHGIMFLRSRVTKWFYRVIIHWKWVTRITMLVVFFMPLRGAWSAAACRRSPPHRVRLRWAADGAR
jgi:hypothetical protein